MVNLILLGAKANNIALKGYLGLAGMMGRKGILLTSDSGDLSGLDVESVLEGGSDAMQSGGSFSSVSEKVDSIGGGGYHLFRKIGIYGILFALMAGGCALLFSNSNDRSDVKKGIIWKVVGALVILGAVAITIFLQTAADGLFAL